MTVSPRLIFARRLIENFEILPNCGNFIKISCKNQKKQRDNQQGPVVRRLDGAIHQIMITNSKKLKK